MSDFLGFLFGTGTLGLIPAMFMLSDADTRAWWELKVRRFFRPNSIRRQHRAGIRQAQTMLRLIEQTHYFAENLGSLAGDFIPKDAKGPYWDAFRRTYKDRAWDLYTAQKLWAHGQRAATLRKRHLKDPS
ncbi:hypothetical protein SEA_OTTAWA_10 [Arthrobacter phage Ottawa]|nr:hypothetical protein SEA_KHARCHO_10 [Arthrobacter phage Kharcho]WIC89242.1 hypothetical protein SEA_OTTAWA_10 [Arthrobacter phage Ottawa]